MSVSRYSSRPPRRISLWRFAAALPLMILPVSPTILADLHLGDLPIIATFEGDGGAVIAVRVEGSGVVELLSYGLDPVGPGYVSTTALDRIGESMVTNHQALLGPWYAAYLEATPPGATSTEIAVERENLPGTGSLVRVEVALSGEPVYLVGLVAGHYSSWLAEVRGESGVRVTSWRIDDHEPTFIVSSDMQSTFNANTEAGLVGARVSLNASAFVDTQTPLFARFFAGGAPWLVDGVHSLSVTHPDGTTEAMSCPNLGCFRPDFLFDDLGGPNAAPPGRYRFQLDGFGYRVIFGEIAMLIAAPVELPLGP